MKANQTRNGAKAFDQSLFLMISLKSGADPSHPVPNPVGPRSPLKIGGGYRVCKWRPRRRMGEVGWLPTFPMIGSTSLDKGKRSKEVIRSWATWKTLGLRQLDQRGARLT